MRILVPISQAVASDSRLATNEAGNWVDEDDLSWEVNEPDAYALGAALKLREEHGGEVIALCAGPERVSKAIRETLAKGADRAIHIEVEDLKRFDTLDLARVLAAAAATESPDLILTGLQSACSGFGQTGVVIAEMLGWVHSTIAVEIVRVEKGIRIKRELEGGWYQHIELPLPAVLAVQSGISKLRYATLMGIKRARSKKVKRLTPAELGVEPAKRLAIERLYAPVSRKQAQIIEGNPRQAAAELADRLRNEARVL